MQHSIITIIIILICMKLDCAISQSSRSRHSSGFHLCIFPILIHQVSPMLICLLVSDARIWTGEKLRTLINRVNWVRYATFCNNDNHYPNKHET